MPSYAKYFRAAALVAFLYAALLLTSWVLLTAALGWEPYDAEVATAARLFQIYGNPVAAAAARVETAAAVLLFPALPALGFFLARRTPGLGWSGLALGALATAVSLIGCLLEGVAYSLAAGGRMPYFLAVLPPQDVILLVNLLADAVKKPAMFMMYPWYLLWGLAFLKAEGGAAKAAGVAFLGVLVCSLLTLGAFAARAAAVANAGIFMNTIFQAGAFVLAGVALGLKKD
jgi:hypothetical protein